MEAQMTGSVLDYNFALPTVRIVSSDTEAGYVIINKVDFDPEKDTEYSEDSAKPTRRSKAVDASN